MRNLKLESDEGIIEQTTDVERYQENDEYTEIYEMYLTNKNLILVYEKSTGFLKSEDVIDRIPLDNIKIVKGKAQIFKVDDDDYGLGMQINFKNGSCEHYVFEKEKETQNWIDSIIELLTEEKNNSNNKEIDNEETVEDEIEETVEDEIEETIEDTITKKPDEDTTKANSNSKSITLFNIKGAMDTAKGIVKNVKAQLTDEGKKEENDDKEPTKQKEKCIYCTNCGEKLNANSKFCNSCGTPINDSQPSKKDLEEKTTEKPKEEKEDESKVNTKTIKEEQITERKTVYDGYIHKCPSCGEMLESFVSNCPACGYEVRGSKALSSVSELAAKLEEIESKRENIKTSAIKSLYFGKTMTKTDEQKISLIRNFTIPNTKEDLYEFLILSKSNISIDSYQNMQAYQNMRRNDAKVELSEAWRAKFEQAYQKAKLIFENDKRMPEIQAMYDKTNKSINKAKWQIWKNIGIIYGIMFAVFFIIILLVLILPSPDKKEPEQLEKYITEIKDAFDKEEYKLALMNAETIDCKSFTNDEIERKCKVQQEYWIDKIINTASEKGIILERSPINNNEEQEENSPSTVGEKQIEEFVKGFEKAEFKKYNSPAEENGLGGSKIYIKGKLEKTEIFYADNGTTSILGYVKDDNGNNWLVHLHALPFVTETTFDKAVGQAVICNVVFNGFSEKSKMPLVILDEMLVLENGTKFNGIQKIIEE